MIRLRRRNTTIPVGVRITLTDQQWQEVAERSASDYHDWSDAIADAPYVDAERSRKALVVVSNAAEWIISLFGPEVAA